MKNLTIEERMEKIMELAGEDISVALNLKINGTLSLKENSAVVSGNYVIN